MLDQKLIREDPKFVEESLSSRGKAFNISAINKLTIHKNKIDIDSPTIENYREIRSLLQGTKDLWVKHREEEEQTVELDLEPVLSSKEQIELSDKLGRHGQSMSNPATLILPFLIYNLEGKDREEFTSDMPWILKKFIVPVLWKAKWHKMKPFLLT